MDDGEKLEIYGVVAGIEDWEKFCRVKREGGQVIGIDILCEFFY